METKSLTRSFAACEQGSQIHIGCIVKQSHSTKLTTGSVKQWTRLRKFSKLEDLGKLPDCSTEWVKRENL